MSDDDLELRRPKKTARTITLGDENFIFHRDGLPDAARRVIADNAGYLLREMVLNDPEAILQGNHMVFSMRGRHNELIMAQEIELTLIYETEVKYNAIEHRPGGQEGGIGSLDGDGQTGIQRNIEFRGLPTIPTDT